MHTTVHANRLRFRREPRTAVRFPGTGTRRSATHTSRTHLPSPVTPGQDYEDVTVTYDLTTGLTEQPAPGPHPETETGAGAERTEARKTDEGRGPGPRSGGRRNPPP